MAKKRGWVGKTCPHCGKSGLGARTKICPHCKKAIPTTDSKPSGKPVVSGGIDWQKLFFKAAGPDAEKILVDELTADMTAKAKEQAAKLAAKAKGD